MTNLGVALSRTNHYAEAEAAYRELVARREAASPPDPRRTAEALGRLAGVVERQGRPAEAETLRRRAAERTPPSGAAHGSGEGGGAPDRG